MPPTQATNLSSAAHDYLRSVSEGGRADASVRVRLEAAAALYKASRFKMAEIVYRSVLQNRPSSYRALLNMGYIARRRNDHDAALVHFQAALAAKPQKTRPKLETATELRRMTRFQEAEALFRSVLEHQPKHVRALAGLGRIAQARGNRRLALNYYRAAVAANPTRTDLELKIAAQLRNLWRLNEARRLYDRILAREPNHAAARTRRRKLGMTRSSGLPPMDRAWLERDTFTRADEWGGNLERLGIPAFGMSLLTLAQDFAYGASEEVKRDCILIYRDGKTKILPLVSDWRELGDILKREAAALPRGSLVGYVPELRTDGSTSGFHVVESHREFVYHRENAAGMSGPSLSKYRQEVRRLQRDGVHIEPIGPANLDRVLGCNDRWFAGKEQRGRKTYYRRRTIWTFENLSALEPLGTRHLAAVLDDDVIGYTVSSHLGASWAVFIYRRCDRAPAGVAPYLLSEMSKLYPDREWINDGPAVRKPGLAWFKDRFTANASDKQMTLGWMRV
jgi:tetratricopeptide (TPR) repeat protein